MKTKTMAMMLSAFYDSISRTIRDMADSLKSDMPELGTHYDFQKKKLLTPDGDEAYLFSFAMITKNKEARDKMMETMEQVTRTDSTVDEFFEMGGKMRAYNFAKEK